MKRSTKISIILVILGLLLMGIGWWNHGNKSVLWSNNPRGFRVIRRVQQSHRPGAYQRIVVDSKTPVTIKAGNSNRVTVSYLDNIKGHPTATVAKGTLTIEGGSATTHLSDMGFSMGDSGYTSGGVLVTVPRDKKLTDITVKRGSHALSLRNLQAKRMTIAGSKDISLMNVRVDNQLSVKSSNGDVWVDSVKAKQLSIDAENGDIGVSDSHLTANNNQMVSENGDVRVSETKLGGGHVSSSNGDIHLQNNRLAKTLTAYTDEGDISAHIAKSAGVKAIGKDADMDDIKVMGKSRPSGYWRHQDAKAQYKLTTADGDITVSTD
ncbi:DUF4097 family beta strand repeat-containing protein [Levilactobacillus fujinensis]|uniref:DUF4097 family beta strand repeat-containing protein n=1 Tax=Levilactobacillus fujinensis TaxID=2486024 RepID=A0ABW1TIT0_9LACO|nr:DUF4097 family beta strand repeat-containing protein [Levilactobacillus fujinensis]